MKTFYIILCLICMTIFGGCASVAYDDGKGKEFKYSLMGRQNLDGFKATIDRNGTVKISIKKQKSDSGDLLPVLKNFSEIALKATTPIQ